MEWLNYHHLLYFWTVVRQNSVTRASQELHLTQPTLSAQIHKLEQAVGEKLLTRSGRGLVLTDRGRIVYRYADEIFSLGRELQETLRDKPAGRPQRLTVGIVDVVPKLVTYRLLRPVLAMSGIQVSCREDKLERLLADLALQGMDVVLSDAPVPPTSRVRVFEHLLGECGVSILGNRALARRYGKDFPRGLHGAPMLLPTENTVLRRSLDNWFATQRIRPKIIGEFEDSALLKTFGEAGAGLFAGPTIVETELCRRRKVSRVGSIEDVRVRYYAISLERRIRHPALATIFAKARAEFEC
jgi:LysR family transcriptional activator of nhaA